MIKTLGARRKVAIDSYCLSEVAEKFESSRKTNVAEKVESTLRPEKTQ
jgi:hypothetical protein